MKNGRLIAILLALLAVVVALSAISFRSGAPVRFGITAGPDSWWACALPGYSGSDYTVAVYPDEAALLAALREGSLDAAQVTADALSALSAEEYETVAVTRRATLTLVQPIKAGTASLSQLSGQTALVPEALRGSQELALLQAAAPGLTLVFTPEDEILSAARDGTLERAFLSAETAARVLSENANLHAALDLASACFAAAGTPAPAACVVAVRSETLEQAPARLRALLEACESSLGYAKKSHQKAALLCVQYGLDGGYGAAEIRAMIPRMGYAWEAQ